eukprot:scaffold2663_cov256-Pinguiococcus_pyrenoidosus.AAC.16
MHKQRQTALSLLDLFPPSQHLKHTSYVQRHRSALLTYRHKALHAHARSEGEALHGVRSLGAEDDQVPREHLDLDGLGKQRPKPGLRRLVLHGE